MKVDLIAISLLAVSFLFLFGMTELLYHRFKWKVELTRKIAHIGTGIITLLFPILLTSHWSVLLLSSSFLLLLSLSMRFNFLQSINDIDRTSYGSLLYPISVYGCFYAYDSFNQEILFFYLPILTLAICDPIAALAGKRKPFGKYKRGSKSLSGTLGFMGSCLILSCILMWMLTDLNTFNIILYSAVVAVLTSLTETISGKGFDNLSIPLIVIIILKFIL
ncbi:hypothetical protein MATR_07500 [Marivirga tractuosa]|uniref:Phosphatidate cytidylyltransferase n=1 Tax=Marivirga tractuosa (strain ATCC 23168 / DSM 4126 / NBRC 15989 / NCIMB 1408 / VKM B-1430 / H-43) TaxID=643867 RepID=E4TQ73_MARTH|nr:phosphatidate cytidylyltransferase [Marivirga tractuosa]ADR21619.1 phosphatidate cytidylyltransferase [Marivirga tractuosa DSM 4126]BDD13925.1 hypothetical protein MATR_07500 [Marivirga tractuosa]